MEGRPLAGIGDMPWAPGEYSVLARATTAFQDLGAFKKKSFNLTGSGSRNFWKGCERPLVSSPH
jgi:hypothetical protein